MWEESVILPLALMVALTVIFYKLNVRLLYESYFAILLWIAIGVPVLVVMLALMAATSKPPQSYTAIAALIGISNSLVGLGLKVLGIRLRQGRH